MTKKQYQMFTAVKNSKNDSLYDVYSTFSQEKHLAFEDCMHEMRIYDGFNFRITSANTFSFSCGFLYYGYDKHLHCRYYTSRNTYDFIAE